MCMYIYIYVCVCVCVCVCMHAYKHINIYIYIYKHLPPTCCKSAGSTFSQFKNRSKICTDLAKTSRWHINNSDVCRKEYIKRE